jgi:hypothetical protein
MSVNWEKKTKLLKSRWIIFFGNSMLGSLFLIAAISKLCNWEAFLPLLPRLTNYSEQTREILGSGLISLELLLGFEMLFEGSVPRAACLSAIIATLFLCYQSLLLIPSFNHAVGSPGDCGCFMLRDSILSEKRLAIWRDLGITCAAWFLYSMQRPRVSGPRH